MNFTDTYPTRELPTVILAAVSCAMHASGAEERDGVAVSVRYDDLNLTAPAGVARLKRRVFRAAASWPLISL